MIDYSAGRDRFSALGVKPEQIIWRGQPRTGLRFRSGDFFAVPFSLVWGGVVLWSVIPLLLRGPWEFPLVVIGPFFIAMAFYITVGRFILDMYLRSQTYYALTADTALIRREGLFGTNASIYLPTVNNLNLDAAGDGSGTITFGAPAGWWNATGWSGGRGFGSNKQSPEFAVIPNVAEVYQLCQAAQRDQPRAQTPTPA